MKLWDIARIGGCHMRRLQARGEGEGRGRGRGRGGGGKSLVPIPLNHLIVVFCVKTDLITGIVHCLSVWRNYWVWSLNECACNAKTIKIERLINLKKLIDFVG